MAKPRILHIILDGFSPSNKDDPWNCFKDAVPQEKYHLTQFIGHNPDDVRHPVSPDMWTRAYSKTKFSDILTDDDFRVHVAKKIGRVPSENFIWNKLSRAGIPSWIYPYGQYALVVEKNMLIPGESDHVSGIIKKYSTNAGYRLDNGKPDWYRSPIGVYYGMHEMTRWSYFKGNELETYKEAWKNDPSDEFIEHAVHQLHDFIDRVFDEYLSINTRLFHEEVLPHLGSHLDEMVDGGYVHIGLVESDVPMHFALIYPDIMVKVKVYLEGVISRAIEMVDPDILIITGDHGMISTEEYLKQYNVKKPAFDVTYNGETRRAIQANFGIAPIYVEHSHDIGAMFYAKDPAELEIFRNQYFNNSDYLMFDLHDYMVDKLTK